MIYLINTLLALVYGGMGWFAFKVYTNLKDYEHFERKSLLSICKDIYRILTNKAPKLLPDGRGMVATYVGVFSLITSSFSFALLTLKYLLTNRIDAVGHTESLIWFAAHFISILGGVSLIYAYIHADKNGVFKNRDQLSE